jgi:SAM-dependent methyltransferase
VDGLLQRGITCLTVLDVAGAALERARQRLGPEAARVRWIEADVTDAGSTLPPVDIWHDRAVFHFLTGAGERDRYVAGLRAALKAGGSAVIATFAPHGPERCSGLPVARYSAASLGEVLGSGFRLAASEIEEHRTPSGAAQAFQWCRFVFQPGF